MLLLCFAFTGCASVKFCDENGNDIGFEYHPAKPYLLIETDDKDVQKARIISIPDMSKTRYVKRQSGLGTVDFSFKITDSMLNEFAGKSDSKVPETIAAVTSGFSSVVKAAHTAGLMSMGSETPTNGTTFKVPQVVDAIDALDNGIRELPTQADPDDKDKSSFLVLVDVRSRVEAIKIELDKLKEFKGTIETILNEFLKNRKAVSEKVSRLKPEVDVLEKFATSDAKDYKLYSKKAQNASRPMKNAIRLLTDYTGDPKPKMRLYEIRESKETQSIEFHEVDLFN